MAAEGTSRDLQHRPSASGACQGWLTSALPELPDRCNLKTQRSRAKYCKGTTPAARTLCAGPSRVPLLCERRDTPRLLGTMSRAETKTDGRKLFYETNPFARSNAQHPVTRKLTTTLAES